MSEEDAQLEEIRRKREERRRLQDEEEKKEVEERQRKEEERRQRKLEREKKAKEREESHAKELEEKQKREQRDEERRKKREERERQRLEEERKEREEEEKKQKEKAEKRRQQEEQEEEERRKRREALKLSQDGMSHDRSEESRPDGKRRQKIEQLLNIIRTLESAYALEKIVAEEDLKEEATKLLHENNDTVCEFFNKQDIITTILKYISTVHPNPHELTDDQREDIMTRMEFAKDAISGGVPTLWRVLLQPENRHYLEQLFSLFHHDDPLLPPINITNFWKSVEFLLYRRSYEISNFMYSQKEKIIASFFKHMRDTNLLDVMFKFVEKETSSNPSFKDFDPKKDTSVVNDSLYWTDDLPSAIIAHARRDDDEWSDVTFDNLSHFIGLVLEKFPNCKLSHQLRDGKFTLPLVSLVFPPVHHTNGVENGANGNYHSRFQHQSTLSSLISLITHLLKFCVNTSSYSTDTLPPLIANLIYGSAGKDSRVEVTPLHTIKHWLQAKPPAFDNLHRKTPKFGILRVKCLQLLKSLLSTHFQCVDLAARDMGVLRVCVDLFFLHVDNNIIHSIVEDIIKMFISREMSSLDENNTMPLTQHLLDECDLVSRLVSTLREITLSRNRFAHFHPPRLTLEDLNAKSGANGLARSPEKEIASRSRSPEKERPGRAVSPPKGRTGNSPTLEKVVPEKEKPFLPPAFVGHVMSICKAITHASEKSAKIRYLVASCSEYHWGQTVLFHLGMRDSADMEWKKPFQKKVDQDVSPPTGGTKKIELRDV